MQDFLRETIFQAGKMCLEFSCGMDKLRVDRKSDKDLVTEADVAVEEYIVAQIKRYYPDHSILGEESGQTDGNEYRWIIDPIDGTTSFVHNQPFYSTSIALELNGEIQLAAVFAPVLDELFFATRSGGASLNDKQISISNRDKLGDCVLSTGFACIRSGLEENNLPIFNAVLPQIRGIRRFGSAAIDLCYVASGKLDGFWELNLNLYDVAAGWLILEEAGGKYTDFSGENVKTPFENLATNGLIHTQLVDIISLST